MQNSEAESLLALADACEAAGPDGQRAHLDTAHRLRALTRSVDPYQLHQSARFAAAGAHESAALALLPVSAAVTGGRLADGSVIGQVVLSPEAAAHSRRARTLAMAWLAAFLRALAAQAAPDRPGTALAPD